MKRPVIALITALLIAAAAAEAGVLYKMVSTVIHKESPRQVRENGPAEPLDLTGEWVQANTPEGHRRQVVRITEDTVEVYWESEGGNDYTLYWAGSYDAPEGSREKYQWKSKNDTDRTSESPMGAEEKTKKFKYQDNRLTYKSGETEVEAERGTWGYAEKAAGAGGSGGSRYPETGDIGEYHIEIGGAALSTDVTGAPAVIVTYTWTNNSEAAASAMVMLIERAYQNGEQLTSAQIADEGAYDADSAMRTADPGSTQIVQRAFLLADTENALTFEVSEFLSHTKDVVTKEYDITALG